MWGYRANLLRNVGMMHARTRYVIMLDADFVGNPTMSDELRYGRTGVITWLW